MTTRKIQKITPKKIKHVNLELKKPSELCQVLFFSDFNKQEYAQLTSMQIDLASTLFYLISEVMNKQKITEADIFEWSSLNHFEINLQTISDMLGKYDNGYYEPIVHNLQELAKVQVLTNTLHKNKEQEQTLFHLIRKISWLKDQKTTHKRVKVWIEPELLIMFHNVNKMYTSFYLQIQYGLNSKYSKLLYEILKDYSNLGELVIEYNVLQKLLNVDINEKPDLEKWSIFNRDILKRAVKEVSDKSDISITYDPIKERVVKKLEVNKVKFNIKKQKSILIDYDDYNNNLEIDTCVVADNIASVVMNPEEAKLYELARKRMEKAILFGTVVKNEKRYLATIIDNLKESEIDVSGMIVLDNILNEVKSSFVDEKNNKNQLIVLDGYDRKHPVIALSQEYLLYSPVERVNITQTIEETINKVNLFKSNGGEFKLIETPGYVDELEISYL